MEIETITEKHLDKYCPRIEFAILEVNEQKQLFNN